MMIALAYWDLSLRLQIARSATLLAPNSFHSCHVQKREPCSNLRPLAAILGGTPTYQ